MPIDESHESAQASGDTPGSGLAATLEELDPALLLNVLVHLTGDASLLAYYESAFRPTDVRTAKIAHTVDPSKASELRERVRDELSRSGDVALGVPDLGLFKRMAELCVGEEIADEFLPLLLEQSGFVQTQRFIEPTVAPPADFDVIVIGAGLVGISAAVKLAEAGFSFRVLEERDEVGGTWSRNVYPGVAVDTPSHYYSLSFELNPDWTHYYPFGPQYLDYLKGVTNKYGVRDKIELRTSVQSCEWDEAKSRWVIRATKDGVPVTYEATAVITAMGFFSRPIHPDIADRDRFQGIVMHSAEWNTDVDVSGKKVTVLGAGCTAVQIVASLVDRVPELTTVARQPHWIVPEAVGQEVSPAMHWALRTLPYFHNWFRLRTYWYASDKGYEVARIDENWAKDHLSVSPANDAMLQVCQGYLDEKFADDPGLKARVTPDFPPFAKRIVKDPGYYDALKRDHVTLLTSSIERFTETGYVTTEGEEVECDILITATGFTLDWLCTLSVTGRDGGTLAEKFEPMPRAHLGVTVPGFPNFFMTSGPNSAILHGGGNNFAGEAQVHYIVECLQLMLEQDAGSLEISQQVTDDYNVWVDAEMDRTVWQHGGTAHGYYRSHNGHAVVGSPWRMVAYWTEMRMPKLERFLLDGRPADERHPVREALQPT